jgi:hypothetical protein
VWLSRSYGRRRLQEYHTHERPAYSSVAIRLYAHYCIPVRYYMRLHLQHHPCCSWHLCQIGRCHIRIPGVEATRHPNEALVCEESSGCDEHSSSTYQSKCATSRAAMGIWCSKSMLSAYLSWIYRAGWPDEHILHEAPRN